MRVLFARKLTPNTWLVEYSRRAYRWMFCLTIASRDVPDPGDRFPMSTAASFLLRFQEPSLTEDEASVVNFGTQTERKAQNDENGPRCRPSPIR